MSAPLVVTELGNHGSSAIILTDLWVLAAEKRAGAKATATVSTHKHTIALIIFQVSVD
jgi:hypothetical protein